MTHEEFKNYSRDWRKNCRDGFLKKEDGTNRSRSSQRFMIEDAILDFQSTDWRLLGEEAKNKQWADIVNRLKAYR